MQDLEMKQKVAQEIMALMDEKDGERLKRHPKLMAAAESAKDPAMGEAPAGPEMEAAEGEEELTPEMLQKLMEMLGE